MTPRNGTQPLVRLDANENPWGPSPAALEVMHAGVKGVCRYPDPRNRQLAAAIASSERVPLDHVAMTAGATETLVTAGLLFAGQSGEILTADLTFGALKRHARSAGVTVREVPLTKDLAHNLDEMELQVSKDTRVVYVCNPNNPTGSLVDPAHLVDFCRSVSRRCIVIVDEAYIDYVAPEDRPALTPLIRDGSNVILLRTFSKVHGLAGLRVGYLIAPPELTKRIRARVITGATEFASAAAMAAMTDTAFAPFVIAENAKARVQVYKTLRTRGLRYVRSHANFIFFRSGLCIDSLISQMGEHGIQVGRPFQPWDLWCRVSMGRPDEILKFCRALDRILDETQPYEGKGQEKGIDLF